MQFLQWAVYALCIVYCAGSVCRVCIGQCLKFAVCIVQCAVCHLHCDMGSSVCSVFIVQMVHGKCTLEHTSLNYLLHPVLRYEVASSDAAPIEQEND